MAAGFVGLGGALGVSFRLIFLVAVLLAAVAVVVLNAVALGDDHVVQRAILAIVGLQVGYVLGLGLRAALRPFFRARRREVREGKNRAIAADCRSQKVGGRSS
ncbi:MAG: hypothetical protein JO267_01380 [Alphaproteobacteria bacterium]|nr:hypothetical protein [Alphaproteobacteria bacterium]